ncbi:aminoglycoside phosphotransferase family protein [Rossellomorea aquimaris]|uniref:aminoglycoside phosphotransferase family protein n=1 Tax=Rossellomorea aquimaris TaxID=189382 RepID=UPI0007D099C1|nr:aminoglycoside phosphotransferase family protein [Rossellomorea aquimaris]
MIPEDFRKKMQTMYGNSGLDWVSNVEELLGSLKVRLHLTYGKPFSLSYNFVVPVLVNSNQPAVLKVGYPNKDFSNEFHALQDFQGRGMVKVLDSNREEGWILLEHLQPGTHLHTLKSEEEEVKMFAYVAQQLWHKPSSDHPYPTVQAWSYGIDRLRRQYNGDTGPLPPEMVSKAEDLYSILFSSASDLYLLHGDLHHHNILYSDSLGWTVIDPKGVLGEREYDCIQFLLNYWKEHPQPLKLLEFRVKTMASLLSLSYERLISYGYCHSILSACWCLEDGVDCWKDGVEVARLFDTLLSEFYTA